MYYIPCSLISSFPAKIYLNFHKKRDEIKFKDDEDILNIFINSEIIDEGNV